MFLNVIEYLASESDRLYQGLHYFTIITSLSVQSELLVSWYFQANWNASNHYKGAIQIVKG